MAQLFAEAPVLLAVLRGPQHILMFANDRFFEIMGHREGVGRSVREGFSDLEVDDYLDRLDQVYATGERFVGREIPFRYLRDGQLTEVFLEFTLQPTRDTDGRIDGVFATGMDVTDQAHARAAAEQAADRAMHLQAVTAALAGAFTREQVADIVLHQGRNALGAAAGSVFLLTDDSTVSELEVVAHAGYDPTVMARYQRVPLSAPVPNATVVRQGQPEWLQSAHDWERHYPESAAVNAQMGFEAAAAIPLITGGRTLGAIGLSFVGPRVFSEEDRGLILGVAGQCALALERAALITAERAARAAAEALAVEREAILAQTAEGVIVADAEGRLVVVNEAARRLHGVAELNVPVDDYSDTYHLFTLEGEPYPPHELPLARAVLHGEVVVDARWCIRRPDGKEVIAEGSAAPITAPDGRRLGAAIVMRDVTAQVQAEAERERLLAETLAAQTETEAALHARDEFLGIASHELRNPLGGLIGSAQLLRRQWQQKRLSDERLERGLDGLLDSTGRLSRLVDDLLDVSRLRAGQLGLRPQMVDLVAIIREAATRAGPPASDRHINIDLSVDRRLIWGDPDRLGQVLDNLLGNAIKYSPDGGEVTMALEDEGQELMVKVSDQGIGLPPGQEERIFQPFGRAPNAASANIPGMGLGLYISRQIAVAHGGTLRAESSGEGAGTTFCLRLPARREPEATDAVEGL